MATNTELTPENVRSYATKHRDTGTSIKSQQTSLASEISSLLSSNSGAMVTKLKTVHDNWDQAMSQVVTKLNEMADTLDSAASTLQSTDESGTF